MEEKVERKDNRNYCLFLFEIIACICVVFIHVKFPNTLGFIERFGRFAVPLFFVVSGFYLVNGEMDKVLLRERLKKKIIRLLILLAVSSVSYFIGGFFSSLNDLPHYFVETFTLNKLWCFLLFNRPFIIVINWFILSLIYVYLIIYAFPNIFLKKDLYLILISSILLITIVLHTVASQYAFSVFGYGNKEEPILFRNWLFNGLPFVSFGILLKRKESFIEKLNIVFVIISLVVSAVLMTQEMAIYRWYCGSSIEFCLFNIVFVFFVIALSIKKKDLFSNWKFLQIKGNWTTYVFLFHLMVNSWLGPLFAINGFDSTDVCRYIYPLAVAIGSVLFALLINFVVNYFLLKRKIQND